MLVFVSFVFLALVIRLPFLIMSKAQATDDGMGVFSKLTFLSKSRFNTYKIGDAINHEGFFPRPNSLHYLVSRLPRALWRIALVLGNIVPDIVVGIVLIAYLDNWSIVELFSLESSLLFLAFSTGPIFFPQTARLKATNGRALGYMFCSLYFVALFELSLQSQNETILWISSLAVALLFLVFWTSTFASQAALFLSLTFALVAFELKLLIPVAVFLPIAWLVKPFGVKSLIQFKIAHTKFYARVQISSFSTRKRGLFNFIRILDLRIDRSERIDLILKHSPVIIASYSIPVVFLILFIWYQQATDFGSAFTQTQIEFCLAILVVFIFTSISWGKLFGESERYLEYAPFSLLALLSSSIAIEYTPLILMVISLQLGVIVLVTLLNTTGTLERLISFQKTYPKEVEEIIEYLHTLEGSKRILCVPLRFSRALSSYSMSKGYSDIKYYYRLVVSGNKTSNYLDQSMHEMYDQNVPALRPSEYNARYGINYFVLNHSFEGDSEFYRTLEAETEPIMNAGNLMLLSFRTKTKVD